MTHVLELENQQLKELLKKTRKQREKYRVAHTAAEKYIKKLEKNYEILVAHNLIHMKKIAEYQDYILDRETNAYLENLDRSNLLKW